MPSTDRSGAAPSDADLLLMLLCSGAASLGYEALWSESLALWLGSDALAQLATLAGYFGGLAVGAAWAQPRLRRASAPVFRPLARLELFAACFALISPWLFGALAEPMARWGPTSSLARTVVAGVALLPGTFCVGAIFPLALEGRRREHPQARVRGAGRLYAAYTAGGVLGIAATAFVFVPAGGLPLAAMGLAVLGCVAVALAWRRATGEGSDDPSPQVPSPPEPSVSPGEAAAALLDEDAPWLLGLAAATGLLGLAVEATALRILGQVFSGTRYTFAIVIIVMLTCTALGSAVAAKLGRRLQADPGRAIFISLGLGCVLVGLGAWAAAALGADASWVMAPRDFPARLRFEAELSARLLGPPAFAMGIIYAQIVGAASPRGAGHVVALNSLAAAFGPALAIWIALPRLGLTDTWFSCALAYLGLAVAWAWWKRLPSRTLGLGILVGLATMGLSHRELVWVHLPEGWSVEAQRATPHGVVTLARKEGSRDPILRRLQVDQLFRMGGAWSIGERRMVAIAATLAPARARVLFLGVGTGATAGGALFTPLESLDAVELVPEILDHVGAFAPVNADLAGDPRVTLHAGDARAWLARSDARWDLIVGDLFHPERDGAGRLFSSEHFAAVRTHLTPAGTFVQWLPLHQLDAESFAAIVRAFLDNFEAADAFLGLYNAQTPALALIGRDAPLQWDPEGLARRLERPQLRGLALEDVRDLLAGHLCDRAGLEALASSSPANRDLHPIVAVRAPRKGASPTRGADRLEALLERCFAGASPWLGLDANDPRAEPFAAYREAVAHFLRGEIAAARATPAAAQAEHYLRAWQRAPEFGLAGARLRALSAEDPALAGELGARSELPPSP